MKHPPAVRALRTLVQVLVAVGALVPAIVATLGLFGVVVDATALVAIIGVAVLVANTIASAIDKAGPVPFLRTVVQVLVALAAVVPAVVAGLASAGVHVDQAQLAAIASTAILVVSTLQNLLEHKGALPTLGGNLLTLNLAHDAVSHAAYGRHPDDQRRLIHQELDKHAGARR